MPTGPLGVSRPFVDSEIRYNFNRRVEGNTGRTGVGTDVGILLEGDDLRNGVEEMLAEDIKSGGLIHDPKVELQTAGTRLLIIISTGMDVVQETVHDYLMSYDVNGKTEEFINIGLREQGKVSHDYRPANVRKPRQANDYWSIESY